MTTNDADLVSRILAGDTGVFELLMRRYNQRLYRSVRSILRDDAEAEDVVQESYVRAYAALHQWNASAQFSTWLIRIGIHEALARVKKNRRKIDWEDVPEVVESSRDADPEGQLIDRDMRERLQRSVEALPEGTRAVFILREVEGLSTAEAADCLEISEDAVKTRLHRARSQLRELLVSHEGLVEAELFPFHATRCDRVVAAVIAMIEARRASS